MTLPNFDESCGVTGAVMADLRCRVLAHATTPALAQADATGAVHAIGGLAAAGELLGLTQLEMIVVKAASRATVTALRADCFLRVQVDPEMSTVAAEKALVEWALSRAIARTPAPPLRPVSQPTPMPAPPARAAPRPTPLTSVTSTRAAPQPALTPAPVTRPPVVRPAPVVRPSVTRPAPALEDTLATSECEMAFASLEDEMTSVAPRVARCGNEP